MSEEEALTEDEQLGAFELAEDIMYLCMDRSQTQVMTATTLVMVESIRQSSKEPLRAAKEYLDEIWRLCEDEFRSDDPEDPNATYAEARATATLGPETAEAKGST